MRQVLGGHDSATCLAVRFPLSQFQIVHQTLLVLKAEADRAAQQAGGREAIRIRGLPEVPLQLRLLSGAAAESEAERPAEARGGSAMFEPNIAARGGKAFEANAGPAVRGAAAPDFCVGSGGEAPPTPAPALPHPPFSPSVPAPPVPTVPPVLSPNDVWRAGMGGEGQARGEARAGGQGETRGGDVSASAGEARLRSLGLWGRLRPYQREGVHRALRLGGSCILADEMGLGKSVQALAVVTAKEAWPCLIIAPAVTRRGWAEEAEVGA